MDPGMDLNCTAYRVKKYESFSFFSFFLGTKSKRGLWAVVIVVRNGK